MSRLGAEHQRRESLIAAAIDLVGEQGSLSVSVKDIATRAGMSPALAFHYFGDKDTITLLTMRHLLREFSREAVMGLQRSRTPRERVEAIIAASFAPIQFDRRTVAAWLVFYLHADSNEAARRLLHVYTCRLRSNLVEALSHLMTRQRAVAVAETLACLIDGIYIRHALRRGGPDSGEAIRLCLDALNRAEMTETR